jgi:hypothetical protein
MWFLLQAVALEQLMVMMQDLAAAVEQDNTLKEFLIYHQ